MKGKQLPNRTVSLNFILFSVFLSGFTLFSLPNQVHGNPLSLKLFPFGPQNHDTLLTKDLDDVSSQEIRLKTPIVFYGTQYTGIYVNQNGLVSFLTDIPTFVNMQFPLDYPTIAPFYSDVDTRVQGSVYYRETMDDGLLERARTLFADHFTSAVNFVPTGLLIVTWDNVGYYDRKSDKTNTYQLVIASDGGESYIVMNYEKIEWIQGTGKNPNLPDAKAQAGLVSGNGPHFSLKGSGTDQVSSLHKRSNLNEDGIWAFRVGRINDQVEEPDINANMESSSETSSSCAAGGSTSCHSSAMCVDYEPGYCCQCARGFLGNGRSCIPDDVPVRFNGKVKGVLNGMGVDDADLFSYILPQDGRSYTAVAKIPERLGYDLQAVIVLGTSIAWLFSTSVNKAAPNGFTLTGGVFNYTAEINFHQTGQKVSVNQNFLGLDVFNHLKVDTRLHGTLPVVPVGKSIEIIDLKMDFTRVAPGMIRSSSTHSYKVEGTSTENPFTLVQTISYKECPWASPVPPELDTTSMKVGKNYIVYDANQGIGRYAITSTITPVNGADPCKENKDKCGPNSSCVVENDDFRCICNLGYEPEYDPSRGGRGVDDIPYCVDVDECQIGTSTCDATALCINFPGSYRCECPPGHSSDGDGFSCKQIMTCANIQCGPNAACQEIPGGSPECNCLPGYFGDGVYCYEHTGVEIPDDYHNPPPPPHHNNRPLDCRQDRDLCGPNADCIFSRTSNSYVCRSQETCDFVNNCHPEADCRLDEVAQEYVCVCRRGFSGDGYHCSRTEGDDEGPPPPVCILGSCYCATGYEYDDLRGVCVPGTDDLGTSDEIELNCVQDPLICSRNAACGYQNGRYFCICNHEFTGDGRECYPSGGGGGGAGSEATCDITRNCDLNAQCVWNTRQSKYACECNPGFKGNGLQCKEDLLSCNVLQNCGPNAECRFDSEIRSFKCQCIAGYEGDGFRCRSAVPCYQDRTICDANADCLPDQVTREWKCQCKEGFQGDGFGCKEVTPLSAGEFLIVTKGMSLIKLPLTQGQAPTPLIVDAFQTAIGIDIDCPNHAIYWNDIATRSIKMASVNGSDKGNFIDEDIGSPEGLSVDWASQNIYWTDSLKDTIEVANLKTKLRKTVISSGLVNPRGIAVYPQRGRLFWSDWNREYPKIEYSGLDGQERQILVGEGLALPNSLVVDAATEELCWADAGTHKIECVGIDGRNRKSYVSQIKYPFGLALGPDSFYWSDWETKKVESASRLTGELTGSHDVHLGGTGKLYGIAFVPVTCPHVYSPCQYNSCGDDRLCLPNARGGRSCVCPDGEDDCQSSL